MTTKVRVSVGATLNLGNYNSARVSIEIESDVEQPMIPEEPEVLIKQVSDTTYQLAENELIEKIAKLINRLEHEGFLPDDG